MNVVHMAGNSDSKSSLDAIKQLANKGSIELKATVDLDMQSIEQDYTEKIQVLENSRCRATVLLTHTKVSAKLLLQVDRLNKNTRFEFVLWDNAFSVPSYLRQDPKNNIELVNRVMHGVFVVSAFTGVGTARFVFVECAHDTLWCN